MGTGKPPKYEPLRHYLVAHSGDRVTLTFAELEAIIGVPLPASAAQRTWWVNRSEGALPQMRAWLSAGWRVGAVRLRSVRRSVIFERR